MQNRYKVVVEIAETVRPKTIVEIGTYQGETALALIEMAKKYHEKPIYWGFDAFDVVPDDELPYSDFPDLGYVSKKLEETGAEVHLVKGNTRETLPKTVVSDADFIFIDGGHTLGTIENDWKWAEKQMHAKTVVVFDDYYVGDYTKGALRTVQSLTGYNVELVDPPVEYPNKYTVHFVKVWKK